ncbi:MAG: LysE family translocator [Acidobacteriota bacterium]
MNILAFLSYCIIVTFTPGPANVVILATVQNHGTGKGVQYASGATLAFGLLLGLSATLSGTLADIMPWIGPAMGFVGAAYMLLLAYGICTAGGPADTDGTAQDGVGKSAFRTGFIMQFINPKVILFTVTVFPGFVTPYYSSPLHLGAFVMLLTAIGCSAFMSWVLLGAVLRRFLLAYRTAVNIVLALFLAYSAFVVSGLGPILLS